MKARAFNDLFRVSLAILNNYSRDSLVIKVAASIRGEGVVEVLQRLMQQHRLHRTIRVDDGPQLTFMHLERWAMRYCTTNF